MSLSASQEEIIVRQYVFQPAGEAENDAIHAINPKRSHSLRRIAVVIPNERKTLSLFSEFGKSFSGRGKSLLILIDSNQAAAL